MDAAVKDLLQLGFSFFVAGYLLVFQSRVLGEVVKAVERLEAHLEVIEAVLVRTEDLLQFLTKSSPPSKGVGGG